MGIYTDRGYTLEEAKQGCAAEIESWYGGKALDVFDSSATGQNRRYYCDEASQLRMVNGRVRNTSVTLMCGLAPAQADQDPSYEWVMHTSTECGKVHTDYVQFTKDIATQYQNYKTQLASATTVAQVDAIVSALWPNT